MNKIFPALLSLLLASHVCADTVREVSSPDNRVALLELYTSEGCSSCPPADRWLSRIQASGKYSSTMIPLAFHVTYWDYIGWQDRFADKAYDLRQRQYARIHRSSTVYTPQFVLDGQDFRRYRSFNNKLAEINNQPAEVDLRLQLQPASGGATVRLSADAAKSSVADIAMFIAVVENDLQTAVEAGENDGETLQQDAVVRLLHGPEFLSKPARQDELQLELKLPADWKQQDLVIVGFTQDLKKGDVLQAVSMPLLDATAASRGKQP